MSAPVPSTPTNPDDDDLRKQIALAIAGDTPDAKHFLDEADAALTVVAPVLEGLRAEVERLQAERDEAYETRDGVLNAHKTLVAERGSERESRIAWAREADRLDHENAQLRAAFDQAMAGVSRLVLSATGSWDPAADAVWQVERAEKHLRARPSVSDQTPATPREIGKAYIGDGKYVAVTEKIHDWPAPSSVQGDTTPEEA